jgi:hypothetical protein
MAQRAGSNQGTSTGAGEVAESGADGSDDFPQDSALAGGHNRKICAATQKKFDSYGAAS